jgi:hypothetical protein
MLDVRIIDDGFSIAVGVVDSELLYTSVDDDADSVSSSLVSFTVLISCMSSRILVDVP